MLNVEMRKYLDILNENEQMDEIKLGKAAKGALAGAAMLGAAYMTDPEQQPFAKFMNDQIEQAQDPAQKAQLEKELDRWIVATLEGDVDERTQNKYKAEFEAWQKAKEAAQNVEPTPEPKKGPEPGSVKFDYNQINVNPTTARR